MRCRLLLAGTAALALLGSASQASAAVSMTPARQQVMIGIISRAEKIGLQELPGMTPEALTKILAFREHHAKFESIEQIKEVSGLDQAHFDKLCASFARSKPGAGLLPGDQPPLGQAPVQGKSKARLEAKLDAAQRPQPKPGEPFKLDLTVRPNFYSDLPGYDLSKLTEDQKMAFLEAVNRELCSCGCKDDSLAHCLVNDPGCPVVKARVRKLYKDIVGSDPVEPPKPSKK